MLYTELLDKNGKKLPKSYYKTLDKLHRLGRISLGDAGKDGQYKLTNPFSGKTVSLCWFAYQLALWILSPNPYKQVGATSIDLTRSDWDNARYIFNVCWPEQYYDLID